MAIFQPFDATTVDPSQGSGSFPVGRHKVVAISNEIRATKDNSGGLLAYRLQIIDGPSKGLESDYRLNLYNNSPKAVEVAFKQLAGLCYVTGKLRIMDPSELQGVPFFIDVGLQGGENPNGYTEIKKVYDMNGNEPGKAPANAAPAPVATTAQAGGGWGGQQQATPPATPQATPPATPWGGGAPAAPVANGQTPWGAAH